MDYERWWSRSSSVEDFGQEISDAWATAYVMAIGAREDDLVTVDPGNGFTYTFDLAGTLREEPRAWEPRAWEPRVVGVWGRSQPGREARDASRMRGHPRPIRSADDRGHLISGAAGGGHDINLVPMDAELNRGWSTEGARFRALERRAASAPGSLFFIRVLYDDDSARPNRFELGVQIGDELVVDSYSNPILSSVPMRSSALRQATALPIDPELISGCVNDAAPGDRLFTRAWQEGLASLSRAERNTVAGITGHVAESVTELLLDAIGWHVVWHFAGPGRHGVDLVFLTPDENVVAIEVKGTLVPGRIPRLSRRELAQMSAVWIDKTDNPGMTNLQLSSRDVYGGVIVVNLADRTWRAAFTADFSVLRPVSNVAQLEDLSWVDAR